jgi:hypothetical protein
MKIASLFVFLAHFIIVRCVLQYADRTSTCSSSQELGQAVFCCNGVCKDGTSIGKPGLCASWIDICTDLESPPVCGGSQVFVTGNDGQWVPSGDGYCWGGDECQWVRNNWTWSCCDCPMGYSAVLDGAGCGDSISTLPCVGCSNATELLTGNATSGFTCSPRCEGAEETLTKRAQCPVNAGCTLSDSQKEFIKGHEGFCPSLTKTGGCSHTLGKKNLSK